MRTVLAALLVTPLMGCAHQTYVSDGRVTAVSELPAPSGVVDPSLFQSGVPFRIGPLDRLTYEVFGVQDFKGEVQVDMSGRVALPLTGPITAAGLTPNEFTDRVVQNLRQAGMRHPDVAINVKEVNSQTVTVEGSVTQPGTYPMMPDMTLLRSIASARGLSDYASEKQVMIFRTIDGKHYAAIYNLDAIRQGAYADPQIYSGDIVVVDESRSKRLLHDIGVAAPGILGPLVILLTR